MYGGGKRLLAALGRLLPDRSGNFATLGAILLPVGLAGAAVAVDEGALFVERREAQALTDLAAITAAANIGKSGAAALTVFGDNGEGHVQLLQSGEDGIDNQPVLIKSGTIIVENGRYVADPLQAPEQRFVAGGAPNNAVRVTYTKQGTRYFASSLLEAPMMTTVAVASAPAEAAFSVGTRLVGLNGGILNALLGELLGTTLSLSVMDYNALLGADVNALSFLDALATELNITAGTYDEVLSADATLGQITGAMARVGGQDQAVKAALTKLTGAMPAGGLTLPLSHLLDMGRFGRLGIGQGAAALDADIGLLDLLNASAALANGKNQVKVDAGLVLPGLAGVTVDLAIGEPPQHSPWFAVGEAGKIVRTAQTRLQLVVTIGGPGGLLGSLIRLPIYLELAYAEAKLKQISCPTGRPDSAQVSVAARPGVAEIWIGEINPADMRNYDKKPVVSPAKLVDMPIVKVIGSAHVETSNLDDTTLTFNKRDIDNGVIKSVSSRNLAQSLTQSLINDLQLGVTVDLGLLSLGLIAPTQSAIKSTITQILGAVTAPVDALLYNVLATLGVRVGEADIRVSGVSCGRSVLVN